MSRRIVVCAALLALVVSLSACKSNSGGSDSSANKSSSTAAASKDGGTTTSATVCVPVKCGHNRDCSACYRSEAERNMGRLVDDWPSGGCCCDCPVPVDTPRPPKECCAKK